MKGGAFFGQLDENRGFCSHTDERKGSLRLLIVFPVGFKNIKHDTEFLYTDGSGSDVL